MLVIVAGLNFTRKVFKEKTLVRRFFHKLKITRNTKTIHPKEIIIVEGTLAK